MLNSFRYYLLLFSITIGVKTVIAQDYNILDFGAKGDGKTLNTIAIQSAIDEASLQGGGRVTIPSGTFLSGSIHVKSGVDLHLLKDATLLGSTNPDHYDIINLRKSLILAKDQTNISITGKGQINGQGRTLALHVDSLFYEGKLDSIDYNFVEMRPKEYTRPQLILFVTCRDIKVQDITLLDAASWVQLYDLCENLLIDSVTIFSDAYWNNDGIDISDSRNVVITNCNVNSADDGICLKSISRDHYCDNITISNCIIRSSASAIKFGTTSFGGFRNIKILKNRVYDTFRSAIAIEAVDGGFLENVLVDDLQAKNTGNAIFIRRGKRRKNYDPGVLSNISLKNITVEVAYKRPDYEYDIRGPELPFFHNTFPSSISGIPGYPVENVVLENIEIIFPGRGNKGLAYSPLSRLDYVPECIADYPEFSMFGELPSWGFYVRHVNGLKMKNITLSLKEADYRPALVFDDVKELQIRSMYIHGDTKEKRLILYQVKDVSIYGVEGVSHLRN